MPGLLQLAHRGAKSYAADVSTRDHDSGALDPHRHCLFHPGRIIHGRFAGRTPPWRAHRGEYNGQGMVRLVSRSRYGKLLRAGVKIYEYQPTMYYAKLMIVDDLGVSVGSTNFDNRSFSLNVEVILNSIHAELALLQIEWFKRDIACSKEIKLDEWARRPWHEKLREHTMSWLHSQL
ncbi:MAG TPA: phospholipase D-like domain-containing protein [Gammaproteobacteria bacterium]|nr:phospholipase D-like domain-containing protein [Gammaproteobacteria bacterium]